MPDFTHIAFSDESKHNLGRYRSIALVTMSRITCNITTPVLAGLLAESNCRKISWESVRTAKERFAAGKFLKHSIKMAAASRVRIDVMTWDVEDSRHKIKRRVDHANLQRMYFKLYRR